MRSVCKRPLFLSHLRFLSMSHALLSSHSQHVLVLQNEELHSTRCTARQQRKYMLSGCKTKRREQKESNEHNKLAGKVTFSMWMEFFIIKNQSCLLFSYHRSSPDNIFRNVRLCKSWGLSYHIKITRK